MKLTKKDVLEVLLIFQIAVITILQSSNALILIPNYKLIQEDLGVSNFYLGTMSGLYMLLGGISGVFWAFLMEFTKIKKRLFLAGLLALSGLLTIMLANISDPLLFIIVRVATGIFLGAIPPAIFAVIADRFTATKRARAYMAWYLVGGIGIAFGYVSSVLLAAIYNWRYAVNFNGYALLYVATPTALLLLEPKKGQADLEFLGFAETIYVYVLKLDNLKEIATNKTTLRVSIEEFVSTMPQGVLLAWLTQYVVRDLNAPAVVAIIFLGLGTLGGLLGFFLVRLADKRFRREPRIRIRIAMISSIIQGFAMTIFFLLPLHLGIVTNDPLEAAFRFLDLLSRDMLVPLAILVFFVGMAFNSSVEPIKNAVISDVNLPQHRSIVISAISTIELFFRSSAVALAGLLIDVVGSVKPVLIGFVMLYFVSAYLWRLAEDTYEDDFNKAIDQIRRAMKSFVV